MPAALSLWQQIKAAFVTLVEKKNNKKMLRCPVGCMLFNALAVQLELRWGSKRLRCTQQSPFDTMAQVYFSLVNQLHACIKFSTSMNRKF